MAKRQKMVGMGLRSAQWMLLPVAAAGLIACGGGGDGAESAAAPACPETGAYACKSGETEPLYTFQWALNYAKSFFATHADADAFGGGYDLNVEPVHRQGIKGQGIKVLVIDSGTQLDHEDLQANADYAMSWNPVTESNDPSPLLTPVPDPHGTVVAGIIGAAQNGKGGMGIAPQVKLGAFPLLQEGAQTHDNFLDAYGGAPWSQGIDIINASYGGDSGISNLNQSFENYAVRSMRKLRGGKGVIFVKAAGNSFRGGVDHTTADRIHECGFLENQFDCTNPANDVSTLEPNSIVIAAMNAKGQASSYSSAGSVVWVTGIGGEYGQGGIYGESSKWLAGLTDGPVMYSTDITGCALGYAKTSARTAFLRGDSEIVKGVKDNKNCDYSYMNGTSAATPSISGVVALVLSANPELTWRDVRDILRLSSRKVDDSYEKRFSASNKSSSYGALFDLQNNVFLKGVGNAASISDGATSVPVELGWVKNAAGYEYSNWYGFGLPDAELAVEWAKKYKANKSLSKKSDQHIPAFQTVVGGSFDEGDDFYQRVTLAGEFDGRDQSVDQLQIQLDGEDVCLGNFGVAVESPAGTKSLLKLPLDHFSHQGVSDFLGYTLGSYAFYGENAKGKWKVYLIASNPSIHVSEKSLNKQYCSAVPDDAKKLPEESGVKISYRIIAQ